MIEGVRSGTMSAFIDRPTGHPRPRTTTELKKLILELIFLFVGLLVFLVIVGIALFLTVVVFLVFFLCLLLLLRNFDLLDRGIRINPELLGHQTVDAAHERRGVGN